MINVLHSFIVKYGKWVHISIILGIALILMSEGGKAADWMFVALAATCEIA